jgi:hypothetical protein
MCKKFKKNFAHGMARSGLRYLPGVRAVLWYDKKMTEINENGQQKSGNNNEVFLLALVPE